MISHSIKKCQLFIGINENQIEALLNCMAARRKVYVRDEFIFEANTKVVFVGIVVSGGVNIIHEDYWGNRMIFAHIRPGEMFGEAFSCAGTDRLPVSVIATEKSEVMMIDYRKIITVCTSACAFHTRLIMNMLRILAKKNIRLTRKMEHLSKRSTREKILSLLSSLALRSESSLIELPFNRQELADYLCVDRSALSRELGLMQREGLIRYDRNRFELLQKYEI